MEERFDLVRCVDDPASYIRGYVDSQQSSMRHLLREMQNRKRNNGDARDAAIHKGVSPSAFDRVINRRRGEGSLDAFQMESDGPKKVSND